MFAPFLVCFCCQEVFLLGDDEAACCGHYDCCCYQVGCSDSGSGLFDDGGFVGDIGGCKDRAGVSVEDGGDLGGVIIGVGDVHGLDG